MCRPFVSSFRFMTSGSIPFDLSRSRAAAVKGNMMATPCRSRLIAPATAHSLVPLASLLPPLHSSPQLSPRTKLGPKPPSGGSSGGGEAPNNYNAFSRHRATRVRAQVRLWSQRRPAGKGSRSVSSSSRQRAKLESL